MVDHTVTRAMDLLGCPLPDAPRWTGDRMPTNAATAPISF
jgi:3-polyprenyl-4-hydroxybenzoate decarboxylase